MIAPRSKEGLQGISSWCISRNAQPSPAHNAYPVHCLVPCHCGQLKQGIRRYLALGTGQWLASLLTESARLLSKLGARNGIKVLFLLLLLSLLCLIVL